MEIYGSLPVPGGSPRCRVLPLLPASEPATVSTMGSQTGLDMTNRILASRDERMGSHHRSGRGTCRARSTRCFDEAREGERVVSIMEAIVTDRPLVELAVNVRNEGFDPETSRPRPSSRFRD